MMKPEMLFKALGDVTRIRILNLLQLREFNVNELVSILDMGQSRISRHLKILSDSGLVRFRRDGLWVFYSIETEGRKAAFIDACGDILNEEPHQPHDVEKAERLFKENRAAETSFFDEIAPEWDRLQREVLGDFDSGGHIIEQVPSCNTAVDLGCGTGSLFPALLRKVDRIIGVDSSVNMLETARASFNGNGNRVDLRLGELTHLPLKDKEADCAVINMVLHHIASIEESFLEAHRILKDNGTIIILDFKKHQDESFRSRFQDRRLGFNVNELKNTVNKSGFIITGENSWELKQDLHIVLITARKQ